MPFRSAGVAAEESARYLDLFEARVRTGQTGAVWQRKVLERLQAEGRRGHAALTSLLERYLAGVDSQQPVHAWKLDPTAEGGFV